MPRREGDEWRRKRVSETTEEASEQSDGYNKHCLTEPHAERVRLAGRKVIGAKRETGQISDLLCAGLGGLDGPWVMVRCGGGPLPLLVGTLPGSRQLLYT